MNVHAYHTTWCLIKRHTIAGTASKENLGTWVNNICLASSIVLQLACMTLFVVCNQLPFWLMLPNWAISAWWMTSLYISDTLPCTNGILYWVKLAIRLPQCGMHVLCIQKSTCCASHCKMKINSSEMHAMANSNFTCMFEIEHICAALHVIWDGALCWSVIKPIMPACSAPKMFEEGKCRSSVDSCNLFCFSVTNLAAVSGTVPSWLFFDYWLRARMCSVPSRHLLSHPWGETHRHVWKFWIELTYSTSD